MTPTAFLTHAQTEVYNLRVEVTIRRTIAAIKLDYSVLFVLYESNVVNSKHCENEKQ